MSARRFILVSHDAGGTTPPMLALVAALVDRGNEVVVVSQPGVGARAQAAGASFTPFTGIPDYDGHRRIEEQLDIAGAAMLGRGPGDDLLVVAETGVDAVVVDANLAGAMAAAETLDCASVVLLHSMYATFVDTWFADLWPFLEPGVNAARAAFRLTAAPEWPAVFAGHDRLLAVVPEVFDVPTAKPPVPAIHAGFLVPPAGGSPPIPDLPPGDDPLVLVSMGTTHEHQGDAIAAAVDVLGDLPVRGLVTTAGQGEPDRTPGNVVVTDYVPHASVLDRVAAVVTHGGLGTVAAALSFGVPLVCVPIERDQPLNASRVHALGAGVIVPYPPSAADLAAAVTTVLADASYRDAARVLSGASADAGGAPAAAAAIEALAR